MDSAARTGALLARAVTGYLALMVAVVTLAPFRFAGHAVQGFSWQVEPGDVALNIALFLPLGFVDRLARGSRGTGGSAPDARADLLRGLGLGALFSTVLEVAQLFAPGRYPAFSDIAANALGAGLGALLCRRASARVDAAGAMRALALELPLVGLTVLLVPVLWVAGVAGGIPDELLLLPVASAAWILASVHAAYAPPGDPAREAPLLRLIAGAAAWVLVALFPAALRAPWLLPAGLLLLVATLAARFRLPTRLAVEGAAPGTRARRFEIPTLRVALVPLVAYTVLAALWPLDLWFRRWRLMLALLPPGSPDVHGLLAALGHVATFTALGYAAAELRGRAAAGTRAALTAAATRTIPFALLLEVLRGFLRSRPASAVAFGLAAAAALLGAWIFVLQRRNVRAVLGHQAP